MTLWRNLWQIWNTRNSMSKIGFLMLLFRLSEICRKNHFWMNIEFWPIKFLSLGSFRSPLVWSFSNNWGSLRFIKGRSSFILIILWSRSLKRLGSYCWLRYRLSKKLLKWRTLIKDWVFQLSKLTETSFPQI